jgi:hypothetical protein
MMKTRTGEAAAVVLAAVSCSHAQEAVQWRVEDGGNGHWYQAVRGGPECWEEARDVSIDLGGDLATSVNVEERNWIQSLLIGPNWYFLGGFEEPVGVWQWISGEPVDMSLFYSGQPDNLAGQDKLAIYRLIGVHDGPPCVEIAQPWNFVIEWSADCNEDGLVDYGQILGGTYVDENGNGVPDCCEGVCPGDLNGDDSVGPPDLGILLAVWGTDGGKISGADINGDGTVSAGDLGLLVGSWGECGGCD